jgi:hypothetical protein
MKKPCDLCQQPTTSKSGVCARTPECKRERKRRWNADNVESKAESQRKWRAAQPGYSPRDPDLYGRNPDGWRCDYCGNEDRDDTIWLNGGITHGNLTPQWCRCKRCHNAYMHNLSAELYLEWRDLGCFICGAENPHVDHDHACCDGRFSKCGSCLRGLLCNRHNLRLAAYENYCAGRRSNPCTEDQEDEFKKYLAGEMV